MASTYIQVSVIALILLPISTSVATGFQSGAITLLPIEQDGIQNRSRLNYSNFSNAVLVQLGALIDVRLVDFEELTRSIDDRLVDDAVFEILVTDELKYTLAKLDSMETETARHTEYCNAARDLGISYLVQIAMETRREHLQIVYKIIDTQTDRVVCAKSFYEVADDPTGVSNEIAKRLVRSLWQQSPQPDVTGNK